MASQAGIVGLPRHALYGAAKAGVINITKTLANEWGRYHINVNAVFPTVVLTPLAVKCWGGERGQEFLKSVPAAFWRKFCNSSVQVCAHAAQTVRT